MKPRKQLRKTFLAAATNSAAVLAFATAAPAQIGFDGAKARVNLSNKLETLSQSIASASCRLNAGIDAENAAADLTRARRDFNTIMDGLAEGSMALGIPSEERFPNVLRSLEKLRAAWAPIDAAAETLVSSEGDADQAAQVISASNLSLQEATVVLAADISGRYSNPTDLTQADAMALRIAARQITLGQQITKNICTMASEVDEADTVATLGQTMDMYSTSLSALRDGMVQAGINPPPNDIIRSRLSMVSAAWQQEKPVLDAIRGGMAPTSENVEAVAEITDQMRAEMANVVTLYLLAAPGQESVYRTPLLAYAESQLGLWLENEDLIDAVRRQNAEHESLTQADIDQLDLDWRAQRSADARPLIDDVLNRSTSQWLRERQADTARFVTEVFAMDNRGLNVAQSDTTSDYWQGDEAKWQLTYGNGSNDIHISEVEYDESTGTFQSQVSMAITDPATGEMIGAITFGIDVQSLL